MSDDLSQDYIGDKQLVAQNAAASELDSLLKQFDVIPDTSQPSPDGKPPKKEDQNKSSSGGVLGVLEDVGRGVVDAPGAVVTGARDAAQEALDLTKSMSDWLDQNLGTIEIGGPDGFLNVKSPAESKERPSEGVNLPDVPEGLKPDSVTGGMIKSIAQFLTGFGVAGKALKGVKAANRSAKAAKAAGQGAVADFTVFDGHDQRLADLVESAPGLQNPITDYLKSDPSDSEAEGRFKNALEGLGLGVVTDGMLLAMRGMRSAAVAKRVEADSARVPGGTDEALPAVDDAQIFEMLGDPKGPTLNLKPSDGAAKPEQVATDTRVSFGEKLTRAIDEQGDLGGVPPELPPKGIAQEVEPETFINFSRIEAPDDVKNVMQQMTDAFKGDVDKARRGAKATFKQIELDADHVDAFEVLKTRRTGQPLNAEQSVAARQLWGSSAAKLQQLAKAAADNPNEQNLFAFRKMMAVHQTIQNEVIAARTETARALASWRIPTGTPEIRFQQMADTLDQFGGAELARDMARRIASASGNGLVTEMDQFVNKSAYARTRDAMLEVWINALLSGPKTHLVNAISNTSVLFQQMYERNTAARFAQLLGDENSVQFGESTAQLFGMISGMRDAFRYAGKTLITGESGFGLEFNKLEEKTIGAFSSEALQISKDGAVGRTVDLLGSLARVPGRSLQASDEFFKTIGYRMELHAQALRMATQEVNGNVIDPSQLKNRIAEIIENPPRSIVLSSIDQALYQTFNSAAGDFSKKIIALKGRYPAFNILIPFVRTVGNLMKYSFERTPLASMMKHVRADLSAGGARRDMALARISTGSMIMLTVADMTMNEQITGAGPSSMAERQALLRSGWQPYSVKVDDRYFAYNRLDPLGMTFGLAADMTEILVNDQYGPEKEKTMEEVGVAVALSVANNVMSKAYLSGLSEFMEAMSDPKRYGQSYFQRLAGSLIPTGVAEVTRAQDPYMREANNMIEAIRRRTPGLSESLPLRRNLWGEPISYQSGLGKAYDMMSPIYSKLENPHPVDDEILRLEVNITMPPSKTSMNGVTVDLERYEGAYSRYVELAGNELKHPAWRMGARDLLNEIITGKHTLSQVYDMKSDGPEGGKADFIKDILNQYRSLARDQLVKEYPEIDARVKEMQKQKRELKLPLIGQNTTSTAVIP